MQSKIMTLFKLTLNLQVIERSSLVPQSKQAQFLLCAALCQE